MMHVIGIYYGVGKPKDSNTFLEMFVNESTLLVNDGLIFNNDSYSVRIEDLVCDAPAKAYILQVKHHTGFNCCTKCMIHGEYVQNTVCFPGVGNQALRTDELFHSFAYSLDYQTGQTNLSRIPYLGLVTNVVLDYMHLVCLGVVRKLISLWLSGPLNVRLSTNQIKEISLEMIKLRKFVPSEFARKPRGLDNVKYWKATEYRQFLLYIGPLVMKMFLKKEVYDNFLTLHVAITILAIPILFPIICTDKQNISLCRKPVEKFRCELRNIILKKAYQLQCS